MAKLRANITFTHTDDPYLEDVEFDVLPRQGEDLAVISMDDIVMGEGPKRIDRVARVRHYMVSGNQHIELILDDRR